MSSKKNGLAALADVTDEIPNGAARLGIKTGGQLVEKNNFGIVDQRESNEESLLLTAGKIHKPSVALVGEAEAFEEAFGIDGFLVVKRGPEVDGLPHFDALLQLGLLQLNTDPSLQLIDLTKRIKAENRDGAAVGSAQAFDALHGGCFSRTVGANQTENLALVYVEGDFVDGDGRAVGFANSGNLDDRGHDVL